MFDLRVKNDEDLNLSEHVDDVIAAAMAKGIDMCAATGGDFTGKYTVKGGESGEWVQIYVDLSLKGKNTLIDYNSEEDHQDYYFSDAEFVVHEETMQDRETSKETEPAGYTGPRRNADNSEAEGNEDCIFAEFGLYGSPLSLCKEKLVGHVFESLDIAEEFIYKYATVIGFSLQKSHIRRNSQGQIREREWVYAREGRRDEIHCDRPDRRREPKPITRVGCKVCFRVNLVRGNMKWICREFISIHSHAVAFDKEKQFLRSSRVVPPGYLNTVVSMKESCIRTCHIMSYMAHQVGGYERMSFTSKDLYNRIVAASKVDFDGSDARRAIGYLEHKEDTNPRFFGKFSYNASNQLLNLFWVDGKSRSDYETYGHAITFDSTYKTNSYGKPLLVWVGVNNHYRTCILGFAILDNESTSTYMWATKAFLECMGGVMPKTIVTDGDEAIAGTIQSLMPDVSHRICYWHIHNKAVSKVKNPSFARQFSSLLYKYYSEEEFEQKWEDLIVEFGIKDNEYAANLYEDWKKWAETFLRGNFFCGMSTTQRSEGINVMLKKKVNNKLKLYEFLRVVDMVLSLVRHREEKDDYTTLHTTPELGKTNLHQIEEELSNIYTRNMFYKVRKQMSKEGNYMVKSTFVEDNAKILKLHKYATKRSRRSVYVTPSHDFFVCECQYFLSYGIPCRHIFAAMKHLHITKMPRALVLSRWTIHAKKNSEFERNNIQPHIDKRVEEKGRFGGIMSKLNEVAYLGSTSHSAYDIATMEIEKLCVKLKDATDIGVDNTLQKLPQHRVTQLKVLDPNFTKSKGMAKMPGTKATVRRKCTLCKKSGHNKSTCPTK
ncbi:protein FAR1-RELATED SEQUENCE 5-like [Humulus lupulus]|uniref:protein FAR1-RELATED SEQUENCE 5-like n=1 Tax=Humulus lupulus TaxID=3486 RepID=UPI002B407A96|nr:protein FAR1-RELATED SEQUENCE 5-like [Humulus lupulus]